MYDEVKMKFFKRKKRGARKSPRFSRYKGSIIFISSILFALAAVTTIRSFSLGGELQEKNSQIAELKKEKKKEEKRTEEIEEYKKYVGTDEYIEDTARDKLNMAKENEILFKSGD